VKITTEFPSGESKELELNPGSGQVVLSKVFNPVGIRTEDDGVFYVCQRDSGLEIKCPNGALIGVKMTEGGRVLVEGAREVAL
jgi:hypothetical protein